MGFLKKRFGNYRVDREVRNFWGLSVVIINGAPFVVDQEILQEISHEQARSKRKDLQIEKG